MDWWDFNENSFKSEKTMVFYNFFVRIIILIFALFFKISYRQKWSHPQKMRYAYHRVNFCLKDDSDSDIECLGAVQEEYETVDTANSGMHTNDQQNQPDEFGRVLGQ